MDWIIHCLNDVPLWIQLTGGTVVVGSTLYYLLTRSKDTTENFSKWRTKDYPKDVVLSHEGVRGPYTPSLIPFGIKAETYMRMAKIPYKHVHSMSDVWSQPKGKMPWFEYNGEVIPDTEFFMEYMNEKLEIDLNKHLSREQRGVARTIQRMVDEHLYWTTLLHRWVHAKDMPLLKVMHIPIWIRWVIPLRKKHYKKQAWYQGMGRHTEEDVAKICEQDLQALSDILGQKKFIMGEEPCETDCAVFGQLSSIMRDSPGSPGEKLIEEKFENISKYWERMKTTFWPDWDDCTTRGGTCEAKK